MEMGEPEILFETDGPLAFVTFNRPEARNAMTWAMYDGLVEACERVDGDPERRVMILRGAGGQAFVAGTDIGQFQAFRTPEDALDYERRLDRVMDRLEAVKAPPSPRSRVTPWAGEPRSPRPATSGTRRRRAVRRSHRPHPRQLPLPRQLRAPPGPRGSRPHEGAAASCARSW